CFLYSIIQQVLIQGICTLADSIPTGSYHSTSFQGDSSSIKITTYLSSFGTNQFTHGVIRYYCLCITAIDRQKKQWISLGFTPRHCQEFIPDCVTSSCSAKSPVFNCNAVGISQCNCLCRSTVVI